jgi:hypothetical protein
MSRFVCSVIAHAFVYLVILPLEYLNRLIDREENV